MRPKQKTLNKVGASSDNPNRDAKGKGGMRSKATIQRLKMYRNGKPIRNKDGKVIGGSLVMPNTSGGKTITSSTARIAPDRRWFGNTRTIGQTELDKFRDEMSVKAADPYSIVLRRKKIPMALLQDAQKLATVNLLETESFDSIFGSKSTRKRPKLSEKALDYSAIMDNVSQRAVAYEAQPSGDSNIEVEYSRGGEARREDLFAKGQSKRIWGELYKVLDSSDVVLEIVDARNVPGTRCAHIERHIKKNASHKQLVIIINKCDLVPSWVTRKWVKILSKEHPTLAFHASITNSFGKGALINLLRQFSKLHADKRQISVGVVGYPNTGKSSVINTLMATKCCKTAPIPGETKIWQYIALMKRIFLIDCPGVVYDVGDDETETVLKGVVRAERLQTPTDFIEPIMNRVKAQYLENRYGVSGWTDPVHFMTLIANKTGKLLKGGEPDLMHVAVKVINDWQRGKLPYFVPPPQLDTGDQDDEEDEAAADKEDDFQIPSVSTLGSLLMSGDYRQMTYVVRERPQVSLHEGVEREGSDDEEDMDEVEPDVDAGNNDMDEDDDSEDGMAEEDNDDEKEDVEEEEEEEVKLSPARKRSRKSSSEDINLSWSELLRVNANRRLLTLEYSVIQPLLSNTSS
eukprot:gene333-601_t